MSVHVELLNFDMTSTLLCTFIYRVFGEGAFGFNMKTTFTNAPIAKFLTDSKTLIDAPKAPSESDIDFKIAVGWGTESIRVSMQSPAQTQTCAILVWSAKIRHFSHPSLTIDLGRMFCKAA